MNKLFETSDFSLCISLILLGYKLSSIDKSNPKRCVFQFEYEDDIQKSVEAYFKGELRLDPRLVLFQAKVIKSMINEDYV